MLFIVITRRWRWSKSYNKLYLLVIVLIIQAKEYFEEQIAKKKNNFNFLTSVAILRKENSIIFPTLIVLY